MKNTVSAWPRLMAMAALAGAFALPVMTVIVWAAWDVLAPLAARDLRFAFDLAALSPAGRGLGFALSLLSAGIWSWGLLGLHRTFREAAAGRALSIRAVDGFGRFAWVSLVMVFVGIAQRTGLIVIFSVSDPSVPGQLSITVGTPEIARFFQALLLVFVAQVFREGQRLREENEGFL
jgi:hypothetical protein